MNQTPLSTRRTLAAALHLLVIVAILCGCTGVFKGITYYDPTTYKNLTDLKPEVLALYDTFAGDSVDTGKIAAIRLRLAQVYEYEKGKGEKNAETIEQIKIIQDMFDDHVKDRLAGARWSQTHLDNRKQNIAEAFDIAIQTEWLKNKNQ
jgi:hypothetical protein